MPLRSHLRNLFQRSKRKTPAHTSPRPLSTATTSTTDTTSSTSSTQPTAFLGDSLSPSQTRTQNMDDDCAPAEASAPSAAGLTPTYDLRAEADEAAASAEVVRKEADKSRAAANVARVAANGASKRRELAAAWREIKAE